MSCTVCPYRTAFLKKSTARKRLYNHHRRNRPLVYLTCKEVGHNETDVVARKVAQMDSMKTMNTPTKDEPDTILETASEADDQDVSCIVINGDEEWQIINGWRRTSRGLVRRFALSPMTITL